MFGKKLTNPQTKSTYKMITDVGEGFYDWNGDLYKSDIVRACIRPKAKAIGKLLAKHIRDNDQGFQTNPNRNIRFLLEEPNPLMTGQVFQEKMAVQLELNNNAFALIKRDEETFDPIEVYPVPATSVEMLEGPLGDIYLRFYFRNGKQLIAPYVDIIHLRQDFNNHDLFGDNPGDALGELMEVVNTIDQGIKQAIKNSAVVKWILKFDQVLKPEDVKKAVDDFTKNYLDIEGTGGAAGADGRYNAEQVTPHNFVPDSKQMIEQTRRIYNFFNTNEDIVQSKYTEDQWNAFYESSIEPVAMQLAGEYTRKIFSRTERSHGNKIIFESSNLQYASMETKLNLVQLVDRAAMTPNEWRRVLNLPPVDGGDKLIMRLDTEEVDAKSKGGEKSGRRKGGAKGANNGSGGSQGEG
ncbi:phage portal protein, HK97 family [Halobacillus aidingensis]|uniref:Phage portal protein, HK97 family n=2 Tax=Halobacillus aidingensis TaxID=240303 RepID=A0A1H0MG87_HALAD|nr:phage portal protein, HK97 family [Halobacillus aidingensis]